MRAGAVRGPRLVVLAACGFFLLTTACGAPQAEPDRPFGSPADARAPAPAAPLPIAEGAPLVAPTRAVPEDEGDIAASAPVDAGEVPLPVPWRVDPSPRLVIGDDGVSLFGVTAVERLPGGHVAVADQGRRIVVFDAEGRFLRTIGSRGEGPGEFSGIDLLQWSASGELFVFDRRLRRITVFDGEGSLLRTIGTTCCPAWSAVGILGGGAIVSRHQLQDGAPRAHGLVRRRAELNLRDQDGEFLASLGTYPSDEILVVPGMPAMVSPYRNQFRALLLAVAGDMIHLTSSDHFRIVTLGSDGAVLREVERAFDPVPHDPQHLFGGLARFGVRDQDIPRLGPTDTRPAILTLLADPAGNVWAEHFRMDQDLPSVWSVFGPAGESLAEVDMPERFQPFLIGDDFVLGVWRDPLDIEHVQVLDLRRGPGR